MTREEPKLSTDIRDFTTPCYVILRREFSEWLEWSFESDLGMRFAKWCLDFAICDFASFKFKKRSLKRVSYFLIVVIRENEILLTVNRDPLFFRFVNRVRDPPCTSLKISSRIFGGRNTLDRAKGQVNRQTMQ